MSVSTSTHFAERFKLVIIPAGQKAPKTKGWQHKRPTQAEVDAALAAGKNLGINLGASGVIDIEIDGDGGEESLRKLFDGEPPKTMRWKSKRGTHYIFQFDERFAALGAKFTHSDFPGLEFRIGAGDKAAQSVCPPSTVDGFKREFGDDCDPVALPDNVIVKIVEAGSKPKPILAESIYGDAQQDTLARLQAWADRFDVPIRREPEKKGDALAIKFYCCPLRGHEDGDATIFVNDDGSHVFTCFHAKCQGKKFADLEAVYGPFAPPDIWPGPDLHRVTAEAINALRLSDLFNRGGALVELVNEAPLPKQCLLDNGAPRLRVIPEPTLTILLSEFARWLVEVKTQTGKAIKRVDPPTKIVKAVAAAVNLPRIQVVTGVVSAPMLRADGSIIVAPGYDMQTGLYLDIDGEWPALMTPAEAVALFDDILQDFPFEAIEHKSAWIAALVTLFVRHAFAGCSPMFFFEANASRVGKGLLTDVLMMILQCRKATRWDYSEDDAEMRKVITSVAIAGLPYVLFDNIKGRLGGKAIEAVITASRWSDRILATNKTIDVPISFVLLGTGNNATVTPDMVGRICMSRLYTAHESPGARTGFKHADLLGYVKQRRRELVMAALSIPAAYIRAGRPKQPINAWGGFDGWNDLVRASLSWAGLPDPDTREQVASEADDETSLLRELLEAWPEGSWKVSNLVKALWDTRHDERDPMTALREAVAELPGNDKAKTLGNVLRDSRGRVVGGKRFVRSGGKNGRKWSVESV
jgi:putative DNA primase/helicase